MEIGVGCETILTSMLVTDQIDTVILGLDWLTTNSCKIYFCSSELRVGDLGIQLHRLTRTDKLEEFVFSVQHRSSSKPSNADVVSRRPCRQCHRVDDDGEVIEQQINALSNNNDKSSETDQ